MNLKIFVCLIWDFPVFYTNKEYFEEITQYSEDNCIMSFLLIKQN